MRRLPYLVGLAGPAGVGKSTIARALCELGRSSGLPEFKRQRFAGPLKDMLMVGLGLTREQVDGAEKETPTDLLCGRTPRHAMVTIGTDWGRNMIGEEIWLRAGMRRVEQDLIAGYAVVIDDCRFDNEAKAVREIGGVVVQLSRTGVQIQSDHASEAGVSARYVDFTIINDRTPEQTARNIAWAVKNRPSL